MASTRNPTMATMIRSTLLPLVGLAGALALGVACDPYAPNLGSAPFRCGTSDPRCPDGYHAVDTSATRCVCEKGADTSSPDANPGAFSCHADEHDPPVSSGNDSVSSATVTPVGSGSSTVFFTESICPASDVDNYKLVVSGTQNKITVDLSQFDAGQGTLVVNILDSLGAPKASAMMMAGQAHIQTSYAAPTSGTYYAQVKTQSGENNYLIQIAVGP